MTFNVTENFIQNLNLARKEFIRNKFILFSPWLNPNKYHPSNIEYNYKNKKLKYDSEKTKIKKKFFRFFFSSSKINYRKIDLKKKKYLFISNLITEKDINQDRYFKNILDYKAEDSVILLRNHSEYTNKYLEEKMNKLSIPRILFPEGYFIKTKIIFISHILYSYFIIFSKLLFLKNKSIKKTLLEFCKFKNITQSIINIHYFNVIRKIIKNNNFEKIFFTFEGHTWERYIIYAAKSYNSKIICIAYQFSVILNNKNLLTGSYGKFYDPDIICVTGEYGKKIMSHNYHSKVINIGSIIGCNNNFDFTKKKISKNCLVMPEGIYSECELMFDFIYSTSLVFKDINFIIRFHDQFDSNFFIKKNKINPKQKNIIISDLNINNDFERSSFCLYRGTTGIFQAINNGLLPIYLDLINEFNIDPMYSMKKKIMYVSKPSQLGKFINEKCDANYLYKKYTNNKKISKYYFNNYINKNIEIIYE